MIFAATECDSLIAHHQVTFDVRVFQTALTTFERHLGAGDAQAREKQHEHQ
jgi:hypothetical protein